MKRLLLLMAVLLALLPTLSNAQTGGTDYRPNIAPVPTGGPYELEGFKVAGIIDPRLYGAVLDDQVCSDITATNNGSGGAIQVTSAGCANFTGRLGELFALTNSSNARYVNTTITSVQSATVATLASTSTAPSGTVTGVYGADAGAATNTYINSQPINSTFIIQWPPGHMLLTSTTINYNARNVQLRGGGSYYGGGIGTGTGLGSWTGPVIVPIFASLPSPASVVYIVDTWGAELSGFAIEGDSLYGQQLALIETQRNSSIGGQLWPQSFPVLKNLQLGYVNGLPLNGSQPLALYGIKIDGTGAQNDRGRVDTVVDNYTVYGISFCPDLSHPASCQAVEWHVKKLTCNRVAICLDQSHGGSLESVDGIEALSTGTDFSLGDSAVLSVDHYSSEHDGGRATFAPLWAASTIYPRNFTIEDSGGYFHTTTQLTGAPCTSGSSTPTWNTTTGGMTNEGGCVWTTDGNTAPPSMLAVALGTGGNPAGYLYFDHASPDVNGWLPPYGSPPNAYVSADGGNLFLSMLDAHFVSDSGNAPTGLSPVIDLTAQGTSSREFDCRSCFGIGMSPGGPNLIGVYTRVFGGDARQITNVSIQRVPGTSHSDYGATFINAIVNSGTSLDNFRMDVPGKISLAGGPLTISTVGPPGALFNMTCNSSGANTYLYKMTATSGAGESTPSGEYTASSCCTIGSSGCTVQANFYPAQGADGYRLYRTTAGGGSGTEAWVPMGVLPNQTAVTSLGVNSWLDSTADGNLSSQVLPTVNTTGNASIAGTAKVGTLQLNQTAVPTPTSAAFPQMVQMRDANGNIGYVPWVAGPPTPTPTPAPTATPTPTAVPSASPTPQP